MIIRDEKGFFTNTMENNAHTQICDALFLELLSGEIRLNVNSEDTKDQRLGGKKMRFWVKILLFISAYTPLFLIFILRYTKYHEIYFWIGVGALILINLIWIPIFRLTRGWTKSTFTIKKSINRTSDALNYIIAYIIAFLGFRFELWQDWVSLFILLAVIFFVYVHSNLIFVNPLLNICGYKIYDIEVVESGSIVLITKRNRLREKEKITVKNMSDNIYQEVI